jgi:AmiR/NasT family two-component response regulator
VATGAWLLNLRELEHIGSSAFEHPEAGGFPEVAANGFETFLVLPFLHAGALIGLLTFGWRKPAALRERQIRSVREIASAISDVTIRARQSSFTIHLANRISQLQAELANGKIADRAKGLLIENRSDAGEVVQHHVSRVLESMSVSVGLQEQLEKLESEVKDRRIVGQAKEFLQEALHLSEEEAYLQLRNTSRQSRRRLPDVASEILRNAGAKAAQG